MKALWDVFDMSEMQYNLIGLEIIIIKRKSIINYKTASMTKHISRKYMKSKPIRK